DRVVVMERGLIVEQGTADAVLNRPQHPYTRRLIAAVPHRDTADARAETGGELVLEVKGLSKTYRTGGGLFAKPRIVDAVKDVSFTLRRGETLGVVGESGSGKSTLGRCLLKLTEIDDGEILFRGSDL